MGLVEAASRGVTPLRWLRLIHHFVVPLPPPGKAKKNEMCFCYKTHLGTNNRGTTQSSERNAPSLHLNANTRRSLVGDRCLRSFRIYGGDPSRSRTSARTLRALSDDRFFRYFFRYSVYFSTRGRICQLYFLFCCFTLLYTSTR